MIIDFEPGDKVVNPTNKEDVGNPANKENMKKN